MKVRAGVIEARGSVAARPRGMVFVRNDILADFDGGLMNELVGWLF